MSAVEFRRNMRPAVRGLWNGTFSLFDFIDIMNLAIRRNYTRAWLEGAAACGISEFELTQVERDRLTDEIVTELGYVANFGGDVQRQSQASGGLLREHYARLEMWVNRYAAIRSIAQTYACEDQKLKWVMNPVKEHCVDCAILDGRVYRASVWRKYNLEPKMRSLACRGYRCGCEFIVTNEPGTRGPPPIIGI